MSVQQQSIQPFTQVEYDQLTGKFGDNAVSTDFSLMDLFVCMLFYSVFPAFIVLYIHYYYYYYVLYSSGREVMYCI